jgi:chloramphenicol-sensitive protein RarD
MADNARLARGIGMLKGVLASVLASVMFGLLYAMAPWLAPLDGEQIFGWRVVVTLPFTTALLWLLQEQGQLKAMVARVRAQPSLVLGLLASAALLGVQLWLFMWAPLHGKALPVSLGYFLLPLILVLAGRLLFQERLTRPQMLAAVLASLGVAWELWRAGGLALETGIVCLGYPVYFALRRKLGTDNLGGHWLDMALLVPAALWFMARAPSGLLVWQSASHLQAMLPLLGWSVRPVWRCTCWPVAGCPWACSVCCPMWSRRCWPWWRCCWVSSWLPDSSRCISPSLRRWRCWWWKRWYSCGRSASGKWCRHGRSSTLGRRGGLPGRWHRVPDVMKTGNGAKAMLGVAWAGLQASYPQGRPHAVGISPGSALEGRALWAGAFCLGDFSGPVRLVPGGSPSSIGIRSRRR